MLNLISICIIPDCLKSRQWRMWEYRKLFKDIRERDGFNIAWDCARILTHTFMLIEEIKCSRSKQSSAAQ